MIRSLKVRFYAIVLLQVVLVVGLIVQKQITLWTGQPLLLKTIPVDPRDLFRGEYVALRYPFSHLAPEDLHGPEYGPGLHFAVGETIYVALRRDGRFWTNDYVSKTPPTTAPAFLRGRVTRVSPTAAPKGTGIDAEYGIESFFVPEGQGAKLEAAGRERGAFLAVEVIVDRNGRSVLRQASPERETERP
jgi:uncharacterized membrane-anchored protein